MARGTPLRATCRQRQHGVFAVFMALGLAVLLGAVGLAVDGGRLLSNRSELQAAADACALGAVSELVCNATDAGCLARATAKGKAMANLHTRDLQSTAVANADVTVSYATTVNGTYDTTQNASRFAKCLISPASVTATFLGTVGIYQLQAKAEAVATLAGGQKLCSNAPLALCPPSSGSYTKGQWLQANYSVKNNGSNNYTLSGSFTWALINGKGASSIASGLTANGTTCAAKGDALTFPGVASGVSDEYNTRFGLYKTSGAIDFTSVPAPDKTGYAYPNSSIPVASGNQTQVSAYSDYLNRLANNDVFNAGTYTQQKNGNGGNFPGSNYQTATSSDLKQYGGTRRILTVVVPSTCTGSNPTINDSACVLMLNPMDNGAGNNTLPVYLEYLGKASDPGSPCQTSGLPSDTSSSGIGNVVPTLIR